MRDNLTSMNQTYNIYLFTGGISYEQVSVYFIGLIINNTYTAGIANMWAGFSYSNSHVNRDMATFTYNSSGIAIDDTFSLLGMAPYSDTSGNVGGFDNVETVVTAQDVGYSIVLVRRLYDTRDTFGD